MFEGPVEIVDGDCFEYVRGRASESFDSIIHDPPRFSLAGELYSSGFYRELYRLLKHGGRLFHYTGTPYRRRGRRNFPAEVARRLTEAGFEVRPVPEKLGIAAKK